MAEPPDSWLGTIIHKPPHPDSLAYHLHQAREFHEAGLRCLEFVGEPPVAPAIAAASILALACELYLKAFVRVPGRKEQRHNLAELYAALMPYERGTLDDEYARRTGQDPVAFRDDIAAVGRAFIDWRYIYERDQSSIDVGILFALARSLFEVTSVRFPAHRTAPHVAAALRRDPFPDWVARMEAAQG